jgi:small-conductance mechanosensitive channel
VNACGYPASDCALTRELRQVEAERDTSRRERDAASASDAEAQRRLRAVEDENERLRAALAQAEAKVTEQGGWLKQLTAKHNEAVQDAIQVRALVGSMIDLLRATNDCSVPCPVDPSHPGHPGPCPQVKAAMDHWITRGPAGSF